MSGRAPRAPRARLPRRRLTPAEVQAARQRRYQPRSPRQEEYLREYARIVDAFLAEHDLHEAEFGEETPEQLAELEAALAILNSRYGNFDGASQQPREK